MRKAIERYMQTHKPEGHVKEYCELMLKRYENH
jgi:hypothetical protein